MRLRRRITTWTPGSPATYEQRSVQDAVSTARATLPVFFDAWQSGHEGYSDFRVTVIMPSSDYGRDYEELSNIRREFAGFIGETASGKLRNARGPGRVRRRA